MLACDINDVSLSVTHHAPHARLDTHPHVRSVVRERCGAAPPGQTNEQITKKTVNKMNVQLSETVKSTYCYYDLYSGGVTGLGLPNDAVCGKCVAAAHVEILRNGRDGNGTH